MELVGKIIEVTPIETGVSAKGSWQRRTLAIQTFDQNSTIVAFSAMGSRMEQISKYQVGEVVRVRFGVASRKVENKYFNDIQLYNITAV